MLDKMHIEKFIERALEEDMPLGDITTDNLIPEASVSKAKFIAKAPGVLAGIGIAKLVFLKLDPETKFTILIEDGQKVDKGAIIAEVEGNTRALLKAERTALNLLQHLSGIATAANLYVEELSKTGGSNQNCSKAEGSGARIADTRKILPGLRLLDKYAVRAGGARNHRFSLSDGVLIKDNHIKACGSISAAIKKIRALVPHTLKIEVETADLDQVREALDAGADIIMLDNMDTKTMAEAVKIISGKAITEASGNVNLERLSEIASTGVDLISVGAITHSAAALDISMKFI
ncbi:MAG: carboxylating nicotinate-nucleotide diphosphorylase [Eubacteriales bacterium]|nr:carboxylating nicotinate-nucleotide diphosphorylase [Eubacteriales bacterium]